MTSVDCSVLWSDRLEDRSLAAWCYNNIDGLLFLMNCYKQIGDIFYKVKAMCLFVRTVCVISREFYHVKLSGLHYLQLCIRPA